MNSIYSRRRFTNGMTRISLGMALGAATLLAPIDLLATPAEPTILHFIFSSMMTNTDRCRSRRQGDHRR